MTESFGCPSVRLDTLTTPRLAEPSLWHTFPGFAGTAGKKRPGMCEDENVPISRDLASRAIRKAAVVAAVPQASLTIGRRSFDSPFGPLRYLVHHYNPTWRNERCIEVPLARAFIAEQGGNGLEVGNVLAHYGRVRHRVVDKYERARGVENVDVVSVASEPLDWIVAISTLEHVGWDETPRDEDKAIRAVAHLRGLLAAHGRLFISFGLGYHPALTRAVFAGLGTGQDIFYAQDPTGWSPIERKEAERAFDPEHHDLVWVGLLGPKDEIESA
jgi:hypothetical protein